MFDEPVAGRARCLVELIQVWVEVASGDGDEFFGLQRPLVCGQLEAGDRDRVLQADDHQQRGGRDPGDPRARFIHPGGARGPYGHHVVPRAIGRRLVVKSHGVGGPVGRWRCGIGTDHRLRCGRLATILTPVVVDQRRLQGVLLIGCDASQALLVAAHGRNLSDDCAKPSVCRTEHDRVPTRVAGSPETDPLGIDAGLGF